MIEVIDYGAGNLKSVLGALSFLKAEAELTDDPGRLDNCGGIILPGVGAFPAAMSALERADFTGAIRAAAERGVPLLGICLGMQMLFESSSEFGDTRGLALLEGNIRPIRAGGLPVPHMGWNSLEPNRETPLFSSGDRGRYVYFVHSYMADCPSEEVAAYTEYGERIPALVNRGRIFGAQFHPEKSAGFGITMLKKFCALC